MTSVLNAFFGTPTTPGDGCSVGASPVKYDTASANANLLNCSLSFQIQ